MSVEAFTYGMMLSGSSLELHINCSLQLIWSTEARQEMWMLVSKSLMESSSVRKMLNSYWVRSNITPWKKVVDYRDKVEEWGPC